MRVQVNFFSYLKELSGVDRAEQDMPEGATVGQLLACLLRRFPAMAPAERSLLIAVGVEYQTRDYLLSAGDEVSLFPPVQGG